MLLFDSPDNNGLNPNQPTLQIIMWSCYFRSMMGDAYHEVCDEVFVYYICNFDLISDRLAERFAARAFKVLRVGDYEIPVDSTVLNSIEKTEIVQGEKKASDFF